MMPKVVSRTILVPVESFFQRYFFLSRITAGLKNSLMVTKPIPPKKTNIMMMVCGKKLLQICASLKPASQSAKPALLKADTA